MKPEEVKAWFSQMERLGEADIPYLKVDGEYLTPRQIYQEALRNSSLWKKIQEIMGDPPVYADFDLLKERILEKYRKGKLLPIATLSGELLTPEKQVEEVKKGTTTGYMLLLAEAKLLEELEKKRKGGEIWEK